MKIRVAGMAWLPSDELGDEAIAQLKRKFTIIPKKPRYGDDDGRPAPVRCYAELPGEFGIPRDHFFETAGQTHDIEWDLCEGFPVEYDSLLRQEGDYVEQGQAISELCDHLEMFDSLLCRHSGPDQMVRGRHLSSMLKADPGFGKTNVTLSMLHRLGRTALVLVHKERLLMQWIRRIERFLPGAKVGIVREDECDFEGKDIVVGMLQSLALEDGSRYPEAFYRWPGVLALDEVHRIGAATWAPVPPMFSAKWRVAMTATPRRKDGADKVFWWHLGPIRYEAKTKRPVLDVRFVESGIKNVPDILRSHDVAPPIVINILTKLTWRNRRIVREILKALKAPSKRKIVVLSERLEHLRELDGMLRKEVGPEVTTGFYVGEWFTGEKTKKLAEGEWDMAGEGREEAIRAIYLSFRRRRKLKAEKLAVGPRRLLLREEAEIGDRTICLGKGEWMNLDEELREAEAHDHHSPSMKEFDERLFAIAKEYDIQQKVREKKKALTEEQLFEAERARVVWMTYQMCSEGIDIPAIDVVGFATPISDVEQAYGRGRRVCVPVRHGGDKTPEDCEHYCPWRADACTGKPKPLAFDVVDRIVPLSKRRKKWRLEFYESVGAKVAEAVS